MIKAIADLQNMCCAVLFALAFCLGGCGDSADPVVTPEINVLGLTDFKMELLSAQAALKLKVSNPNSDPIALEGIRVRLLTNGNTFAKGMGALSGSVPAFGSVEVKVPVTISNLSLLRTARGVGETRSTGKLSHGVDADLTFSDSGGKRHRRDIKKEGELDLSFMGSR